jgi:Fic family protein
VDVSAYSEQAAGRLVRQGKGDATFHAFVPTTLPPDLQFDLDLTNRLARATAVVGELAGLARTLGNPYLFVRPFIRREAVASSRIEGTQAELGELYVFEAEQRVLPGMTAPTPASAAQEVYNYVLALDYGLDRLREFPLSLRLIREVHQRLMFGVRGEHGTPGEFRRSQNWIGPEGCTLNEATYVPPPVHEMNASLSDFEQYLHADGDAYHPLVRLAFIHYQFEAIHPFVDGNGRLGRLLLSLLAVHWGLIPQPLLYLSAFFERYRQQYYDLLMSVTTRGEWRTWTEFFLQAVTDQSADAISRTKRLQDLQVQWRGRLTRERSPKPLLLLEHLFEAPVLSIPQAQAVLGTTYRGAQLNVQKLVEHGILRPLGDATYGKLYIAEAILAVLRDGGGQ